MTHNGMTETEQPEIGLVTRRYAVEVILPAYEGTVRRPEGTDCGMPSTGAFRSVRVGIRRWKS